VAPCSSPEKDSDAGRTLEHSARLEVIHELLEEGKHDEAERAARVLLDETRTTADSQPTRVADALDVLVQALWRHGTHEEMWELAHEALRIREDHGAPDDPALARSLRNLADLHLAKQEFTEALQRCARALRILEDAYGADDERVGACHTDIAIVHSIRGDYEAAIRGYDRAIEIHEAASSPNELQIAFALNGLGLVFYEIGDYVGARARHEQALEIRERLLPADHTKIAESLNSLSVVFLETGDHATALENFGRVVEIRVKGYGPEHRLVGRALNNRAVAELRTGHPGLARNTATHALQILERHKDNLSIAACLGVLGLAHQDLGQYAQAYSCFERARAMREGDPEHVNPYLIVTLEELARLGYETADLEAARSACNRAIALCEQLFAEDHPLIAKYEALRATILAELGEREAAFDAASRAENVRSAHLRLTSQVLSEREALLYSQSQERGLDVLVRLADAAPSESTVQRSWEAVIRSRASVLDEMVARSRRASLSSDPEVARLFEALRQASSRYGNLALRGARGMAIERYRELLRESREAKERAERALALESLAFRRDAERASLGFDEIAQSLPEGSALVSYVAYDEPERPIPAGAVPADSSQSRKPRPVCKMAAMVLRAGERTPRLVSLGLQSRADARVRAWGTEAALGLAIAGRSHAQAESACVQAGEELRRMIWDPIAPAIGNATLVFVVPDASLYRVNLAALPHPSGGYLVESGLRFHYLTSERDLVVAAEEASRGAGLLAIGGADFDGTRASGADPAAEERASTGRVARSRAAPCQFDQVEFPPLPATMREVREIAALWDTPSAPTTRGDATLLTGTEATETAFKLNASRKAVLHLATHGFFLDERCAQAASGTRGLKQTGSVQARAFEPPANPLLLAGLAFEGANERHDVEVGQEDGILVAEEIAALDLQGVEWAVLSACETGIGKVVSGEGVLGLRRAFQVAGARSLIMSLWAVGDEPTREWMRALYAARLTQSAATVDAVQRAHIRILDARRERGRGCEPCDRCSTHPFYWASFVAAGDWR
jgi:CHAT domain-containing protein/tetratricopeptide (TPR) repeat protein